MSPRASISPLVLALFLLLFCSVATAQVPDPTEARLVVWNLRNYQEANPLPLKENSEFAQLEALAVKAAEAAPARANPPRPKEDAEVQQIVDTLVRLRPGIAVFCEMGQPHDLASLQQRLHRAGLPLPHWEYVQGPDPDRHLALLSAYPIVERFSQPWSAIAPGGSARYVSRGFLGASVELQPGTQVAIIGAHLKSAREEDMDPDLLRREEALALRKVTLQKATAAQTLPMYVVGDLNDDRASPVLRQIVGFMDSAEPRLAMLNLEDALGDRWTHHWAEEDAYSRIDYILTNPAGKALLKPDAQYIERYPPVGEASDHRPLVVTLKFP